MRVYLNGVNFNVNDRSNRGYKLRELNGSIKVNAKLDIGSVLNQSLQFQKDIEFNVSQLPKDIQDKLVQVHDDIQTFLNKNIQTIMK